MATGSMGLGSLQYQSDAAFIRSAYDELTKIQQEAKNYAESSNEFNDCEGRSQAVYQRFETGLRSRLGLDKPDPRIIRQDALFKRLDFLDRRPWHDPNVVQRCDTLAKQTAPKFNWISNVTDFSQITWNNVKVFDLLDDFQTNLCCSKNKNLIKTTVDIFEKFKKRIDDYKPTLCQKIWQIITFRFTFIKINRIREYLADLDILYITESITK